MPIPKPKSGEAEKDYINRCMGAIGDEYDDNKQAVAVCYQKWNDRNKKSRNMAKEPKLFEVTEEIFAEGIWNGMGFATSDLQKIVETFDAILLQKLDKTPLTHHTRPYFCTHVFLDDVKPDVGKDEIPHILADFSLLVDLDRWNP